MVITKEKGACIVGLMMTTMIMIINMTMMMIKLIGMMIIIICKQECGCIVRSRL